MVEEGSESYETLFERLVAATIVSFHVHGTDFTVQLCDYPLRGRDDCRLATDLDDRSDDVDLTQIDDCLGYFLESEASDSEPDSGESGSGIAREGSLVTVEVEKLIEQADDWSKCGGSGLDLVEFDDCSDITIRSDLESGVIASAEAQSCRAGLEDEGSGGSHRRYPARDRQLSLKAVELKEQQFYIDEFVEKKFDYRDNCGDDVSADRKYALRDRSSLKTVIDLGILDDELGFIDEPGDKVGYNKPIFTRRRSAVDQNVEENGMTTTVDQKFTLQNDDDIVDFIGPKISKHSTTVILEATVNSGNISSGDPHRQICTRSASQVSKCSARSRKLIKSEPNWVDSFAQIVASTPKARSKTRVMKSSDADQPNSDAKLGAIISSQFDECFKVSDWDLTNLDLQPVVVMTRTSMDDGVVYKIIQSTDNVGGVPSLKSGGQSMIGGTDDKSDTQSLTPSPSSSGYHSLLSPASDSSCKAPSVHTGAHLKYDPKHCQHCGYNCIGTSVKLEHAWIVTAERNDRSLFSCKYCHQDFNKIVDHIKDCNKGDFSEDPGLKSGAPTNPLNRRYFISNKNVLRTELSTVWLECFPTAPLPARLIEAHCAWTGIESVFKDRAKTVDELRSSSNDSKSGYISCSRCRHRLSVQPRLSRMKSDIVSHAIKHYKVVDAGDDESFFLAKYQCGLCLRPLKESKTWGRHFQLCHKELAMEPFSRIQSHIVDQSESLRMILENIALDCFGVHVSAEGWEQLGERMNADYIDDNPNVGLRGRKKNLMGSRY